MNNKKFLIANILLIANFSFANLQPEFFIDIENIDDSNKEYISELRDAFIVENSSYDSFDYIDNDLNQISCKYVFRSKNEQDKFYNEIFICKDNNSLLHDILYVVEDSQILPSKKVFLSHNQKGWGITLNNIKDLKSLKQKNDFSGIYHSPKTTEGGRLTFLTGGVVDYEYLGDLVIERNSFKLDPQNTVPAADEIADRGGSVPLVGELITEIPEAITSSKTAYGIGGCLAGGAAGAGTGAAGTAILGGADLGSFTLLGALTGCAIGGIFGYSNSAELDNKRYCSIYSDLKDENHDLICQDYQIEINNRKSMFDGVLTNPKHGLLEEYETYIVLDFPYERKNVSFCKSDFESCDQD